MNDVRFGLRILARNPGSSALIVSLLALGIGGSATIFSLFDAVLLRRLPVPHPEQLVRLVQRFPKPLGARSEFPYVYYKALRERSKTLEVRIRRDRLVCAPSYDGTRAGARNQRVRSDAGILRSVWAPGH